MDITIYTHKQLLLFPSPLPPCSTWRIDQTIEKEWYYRIKYVVHYLTTNIFLYTQSLQCTLNIPQHIQVDRVLLLQVQLHFTENNGICPQFEFNFSNSEWHLMICLPRFNFQTSQSLACSDSLSVCIWSCLSFGKKQTNTCLIFTS